MTAFAFELVGVGKRFPSFSLSDMSLRLETGQIMGLVGRNGAGKSTTIRILMGLIRQDAGEVFVLGHTMPKRQIEAKRQIGFVSEDMRLYKDATLGWHMRFVASIFPEWDQAYAESLLQRFRLRPEQTLKRVSHGERVKATLLLALARRPKLLILDEPTTGLDPVARRDLLGELMQVLLDEERTILFSSHNTQDVEQLADQIAFIDCGRLLAADDKESFLDSWHRLRLEIPAEAALTALPGTLVERTSPHTAVAIVRGETAEAARALQDAGAQVLGTERMTLEEIFLASVEMADREAPQ